MKIEYGPWYKVFRVFDRDKNSFCELFKIECEPDTIENMIEAALIEMHKENPAICWSLRDERREYPVEDFILLRKILKFLPRAVIRIAVPAITALSVTLLFKFLNLK